MGCGEGWSEGKSLRVRGGDYWQQHSLQGTVGPAETPPPTLAHLLSTPPSPAPWVPIHLRSEFSLASQCIPWE